MCICVYMMTLGEWRIYWHSGRKNSYRAGYTDKVPPYSFKQGFKKRVIPVTQNTWWIHLCAVLHIPAVAVWKSGKISEVGNGYFISWLCWQKGHKHLICEVSKQSVSIFFYYICRETSFCQREGCLRGNCILIKGSNGPPVFKRTLICLYQSEFASFIIRPPFQFSDGISSYSEFLCMSDSVYHLFHIFPGFPHLYQR